MTVLVGLSGYARSGKDTAARVMAQEGFQRIAFADKLREALLALNPIVDIERDHVDIVEGFSGEIVRSLPEVTTRRVSHVIEAYGWDGYKSSPWGNEVRVLMQRLGTEVARDILGEDIWVNAALRPIDNFDKVGKYVVTDVRFPNEAEAIRKRGGMVLRITRPGVGPANDHSTEHALDNYTAFNGYITNDGTPGDMLEQIRHYIS